MEKDVLWGKIDDIIEDDGEDDVVFFVFEKASLVALLPV